MRIAFIATGGFDPDGRDVVPALTWLVERVARRHDVHVFTLHYYREPRTYRFGGATVHDIGRVGGLPGVRRLRAAARLGRAIDAAGPFDVIHAYWGLPASMAAGAARRSKTPLVVTLDSGELVAIDDVGYGLQRRWIDRRAVALAVAAAARVTVATRFMARLPALRDFAADVVPIGIDARLFPPAAAPDGPPWRLLRVASINPVKDHATLLRALAALRERLPQVHLDVVGADTMRGSMQALARSLGVDDAVAFHGFQPTAALPAFYARAHLHVVSSRHEAASVAVLEAAASGVPTVGSAVGYVSDWADDGRSVAVAVGDPRALAMAIERLLRDPSERARLAASARGWTLAHDADWTAARFEEIYAECAGATPTV